MPSDGRCWFEHVDGRVLVSEFVANDSRVRNDSTD